MHPSRPRGRLTRAAPRPVPGRDADGTRYRHLVVRPYRRVVASKAQRKRATKRRKQDRGVALSDVNVEELPGALRHVLEAANGFEQYLFSQPSPEAAVAATTEAVRDAAQRIADLAAPFDVFDVLESVRLNELTADPETYQETEHAGSAAVVEIVAAVLAARGKRAGTARDADGHRARPDATIEEILDAAREAVAAGSMLVIARVIAEHGHDGALSLGSVLREVFVRNLSYPHMVDDTLAGLFDEPTVAAACSEVLGWNVLQARVIFGAVQDLHQGDWQRRMASFAQFATLAMQEMRRAEQAGAWPPTGDAPTVGADYEVGEEVRARAVAFFDEAWADPGDAGLFDLEAISDACSVDVDTVMSVLSAFALPLEERDVGDAALEFFAGRSPFRTTPILDDGAGSRCVVHHGLLGPAIKERVEGLLKGSPKEWNIYASHRGRYLEEEALRLLAGMLPGAVVHSGFEYFVPDPQAASPQTDPASFTKLVEGDGLLVVDDVAVIVEAKSGALSPLARTGDPKRLEADLRKIVTEAAAQADRLRERIVVDGGIRLRDGSWLDLAGVREIHSVGVSLEDLSGIATVTSHVVAAGLLPHGNLPWTVSLHDLRIVTEIVDRPPELLLYLRRRTEPDVTRKFHAVDELDFFLEFLWTGLYIEPNPDDVFAELPQFGEPSVAVRRRYKAQRWTFLTSRTDALDAYYFHQTGDRVTPSPKPTMNAQSDLLLLVDALVAQQAPGWLSMTATILDASGPTQRQWSGHAAELLERTARDGRPHTMCVAGGARRNSSFVLIWASKGPGESLALGTRHLEMYVRAKKHQTQVARGFGMLFDRGSSTVPVVSFFDNSVPGPDAALDAVVEEVGLRPIEWTSRSLPPKAQRRSNRPGRVTRPAGR